jgi:hypothetical protein
MTLEFAQAIAFTLNPYLDERNLIDFPYELQILPIVYQVNMSGLEGDRMIGWGIQSTLGIAEFRRVKGEPYSLQNTCIDFVVHKHSVTKDGLEVRAFITLMEKINHGCFEHFQNQAFGTTRLPYNVWSIASIFRSVHKEPLGDRRLRKK